MNDSNEVICDFSNLVANEVEIETSNETSKSNKLKCTRKLAEPFFEPADYANGALYDNLNYCWSQTFTEIGQFHQPHFQF